MQSINLPIPWSKVVYHSVDKNNSLEIFCWIPKREIHRMHDLGFATDRVVELCSRDGLEVKVYSYDFLQPLEIDLGIEPKKIFEAYLFLFQNKIIPTHGYADFDMVLTVAQKMRFTSNPVISEEDQFLFQCFIPFFAPREKE